MHNHGDSHCWLTVLAGCVHELQYAMPGEGADGSAGSGGSSVPVAAPALPGVLGATAPCPRLRHIGTHELQVGRGAGQAGLPLLAESSCAPAPCGQHWSTLTLLRCCRQGRRAISTTRLRCTPCACPSTARGAER